MNESGLNGSEKGLVNVDINFRESVYEVLEERAKRDKLTVRGLIVEIIESWVSDINMKARLKEEKDSKKIYTETPDPEPEKEEGE